LLFTFCGDNLTRKVDGAPGSGKSEARRIGCSRKWHLLFYTTPCWPLLLQTVRVIECVFPTFRVNLRLKNDKVYFRVIPKEYDRLSRERKAVYSILVPLARIWVVPFRLADHTLKKQHRVLKAFILSVHSLGDACSKTSAKRNLLRIGRGTKAHNNIHDSLAQPTLDILLCSMNILLVCIWQQLYYLKESRGTWVFVVAKFYSVLQGNCVWRLCIMVLEVFKDTEKHAGPMSKSRSLLLIESCRSLSISS